MNLSFCADYKLEASYMARKLVSSNVSFSLECAPEHVSCNYRDPMEKSSLQDFEKTTKPTQKKKVIVHASKCRQMRSLLQMTFEALKQLKNFLIIGNIK